MNYEEFLKNLQELDWRVEGKSHADKEIDRTWQIAFIRMGGRLHRPGSICFVICIRHKLNRNLDEQIPTIEKEPHSYPYKLTMQEIVNQKFSYQCKLNNYDVSYKATDSDWNEVTAILESTIPNWLNSHSSANLREEIKSNGEDGYIEKLWIDDLQNDA